MMQPEGTYTDGGQRMTLLIMFGGFMVAVTALTYIEIRRIRKKLPPNAVEPKG